MNQRENQYETIAEIAYSLAKRELPKYAHIKSTNHYELPQLVACILIMHYLGLSHRGMYKWLLDNKNVCQILGLEHVPHHTTLQRISKKLGDLDFEKLKEEIIQEKNRKKYNLRLKQKEKLVEAEKFSWINRLIVLWLAGMIALLPIKILNIPYNFEMVDIWTLGGIPVMVYLYYLKRPRVISYSYTIPMWFVLISSFISAFASPAPTRSIIVILKEVYLFIWFFVVMALLFQMSAKNMRWVLRVWSVVVLGHGLLMIAQFFSPEVWRFTNALGGNTARYDVYRAAGLFICDKAGCANKAAIFQLMGFVPLMLAGYSKRTTILFGVFLFASMMTSGSMGATLAFTSGLTVAIFAIAYIKKNLGMILKNIFRVVLALLFLAGLFLIVGSSNSSYTDHFERIIVGRFDKSSSGRLNLWGRGIDVLLEHNAFFWGVGPENFRIVDEAQTDNQLHNDTLAFLVERGLIGLIGLGLFAGITFVKAIQIIRIYRKEPKRAQLGVIVFLSMLVAIIVESLTHQVFHTRELWLALAVQEAVLYKMITSEHGIVPAVQSTQEISPYRPEIFVGPGAILEN